jgi:hypothetical protein
MLTPPQYFEENDEHLVSFESSDSMLFKHPWRTKHLALSSSYHRLDVGGAYRLLQHPLLWHSCRSLTALRLVLD